MANMLAHFLALSLFITVSSATSPLQSSLISAMSHAVLAHQAATAVDLGSLDEHAKAAWADCVLLHEDTIRQLNRTMTSASSTDDVQTWLSAAFSNQETCRNGFIDLNSPLPQLFSSFMTGNLSRSLSNSLAICKGRSSGGNRRLLSDGFPTWVSAADRKLLQSSGVKANIVVAQDGTGNYKTITEALAASVNLMSGAGRSVIHIKAGVYNENVQVTTNNVMFVGDGIDATVITASKNVHDGSTTFRSATFAVTGDGFIAQDITFQNTAGPQKHQAVALRSGSDLSVFCRCSFLGLPRHPLCLLTTPILPQL